MPKEIRYEIMKNKRFFIPSDSRACDMHSDYSVWADMVIPQEKCSFTVAQIEEMVDLLRTGPKPSKNMVQGK